MDKLCNIFVNYNDGKQSASQASIRSSFNTIDHVVVVDNKSTDSSWIELSAVKSGSVKLVQSGGNYGFARGNNIGAITAIELYNPRFLLFANPDSRFTNEDVASCIEALESHNELGLVSMRMTYPNGVEERSSWPFRGYLSQLASCFWGLRRRQYHQDLEYAKNGSFNYADVVRGSFLCLKTQAFMDAGMFDENTFLYYEEDILCRRLRRIGYAVGILSNRYYIQNQKGPKGKPLNPLLRTYLMDSQEYLLRNYLNVGPIRMGLFKLARNVGLFEDKLVEMVRDRF